MLSVVLTLVTLLVLQQRRLLANRSLHFERQYAVADQAYADFQHKLALEQIGAVKIPSRGYTADSSFMDFSAQAGDVRQTFRGVASTTFPIGLVAQQGDLEIRTVRSVHDYDNGPRDERLMGLMAQIAASGNVRVNGHLNGHAYSQSGQAVCADGSGILHSHPEASPTQLSGEFEDAVSSLRNGLQSQTELLAFPSSIPVCLRIPPDQSRTYPSGLRIGKDLVIGDNSVLLVKGDLYVSGAVYLGRHSSLMVQGAATCSGLNLSYSWHRQGLNLASICSCVYSLGSLQILGKGMACAEITDWVPGDPAWPDYLGSCKADEPDTVDVPGVLLVCDSNLLVQGGQKVAGLLYAQGIQLSGVDQLLGVAWSRQSLQAGDTNYRYFPFYSHAFAHTSAANVILEASRSHATAWGQFR
ncbi:hypothetical protein JST97_02565 [bacterium]|nr:hypothetical protein [bacterium]